MKKDEFQDIMDRIHRVLALVNTIKPDLQLCVPFHVSIWQLTSTALSRLIR